MDMDTDGDGHISQVEYVLFNLIARRDIDIGKVEALKAQFNAMDTDGGGTLTVCDFPTTVCIKRTTTVTGGAIVGVELDVVNAAEAKGGLKERTVSKEKGESAELVVDNPMGGKKERKEKKEEKERGGGEERGNESGDDSAESSAAESSAAESSAAEDTDAEDTGAEDTDGEDTDGERDLTDLEEGGVSTDLTGLKFHV
jgi:hypothetical protein